MTIDEWRICHRNFTRRLALDLCNKPFPILRQPIVEPWRDRLERWLDDKITRKVIRLPNNSEIPLWFKTYRVVRRSYLYRRFILEQL